MFSERDSLHSDDALRLSSPLSDGGSFLIESEYISLIQKRLPTRIKVFQLFNYHNDWLL